MLFHKKEEKGRDKKYKKSREKSSDFGCKTDFFQIHNSGIRLLSAPQQNSTGKKFEKAVIICLKK